MPKGVLPFSIYFPPCMGLMAHLILSDYLCTERIFKRTIMSIRKLRTQRKQFDNDAYFTDFNMDSTPLKEPESWNIITALNHVLIKSRHYGLCDDLWEACKPPLTFLNKELGLNDIQIVVLALLVEDGHPLSWRKLGNYLHCSRLSMMVYSEDIEELVKKRWLVHRGAYEEDGFFEGFALEYGVVSALRHNKPFVPEKIDGLNEQQLIDKIESRISRNMNDNSADFKHDEKWMLQLVSANPHLPLCQEILGMDNIHDQSLLLLVAVDYAQWAESENEGLSLPTISSLYPQEFDCDYLRRKLVEGTHYLMQKGYIEHKCEDGIVNTTRYMLTSRTKHELLSDYTPTKSRSNGPNKSNRFLKSHTQIKEKTLFYNASEQEQIERLTSLLSTENLPAIQQRLEEQGMRKGFACLFYGAPGTGKTETVLQIARQTGRDIMQVDISGLRDKWVGESEKNIKAIFNNYRKLCKNSEVMPILFFNEADAIINKRTENIEHSVDKMDNAMQNIILQELEDLNGILIATTNLTKNLDHAFERRFLFKVEFHKPECEVKTKIWQSMLQDLSPEDARTLASRYDFSGGQIENISRKRTINYILTGRYASLHEIETYCRTELLDNPSHRKPVVGFTR